MTEKGILAYFNDPAQAEGIAAKLKALRAIDVRVDRFSRYPGAEATEQIFDPSTGNIRSLATLTQDAALGNRDSGILIAADPAASGYSDGASGMEGGVTGKDILLTAVVDESMHQQALRVIQEGGGDV
jgi:N-acetylmuramoyl-L-alanine amidase